ncbi:DUF1294 domain-containing protein [Litorimonas sp. WD9-15]|uniref:DUF1294 domain-containing protein n=1 Tax=Litorimonas sp. WD9-15 TaxID=3418716 RepID=UPI003CFEC0A4
MLRLYIGFAIAVYVLLINFVGYTAFFVDKRAAQSRDRRISESTLLFIALLGGTLGCIWAQQKFRHKTRKQPFKLQLQIIVVLQVITIFALAFPDIRTLLWQTLFSN